MKMTLMEEKKPISSLNNREVLPTLWYPKRMIKCLKKHKCLNLLEDLEHLFKIWTTIVSEGKELGDKTTQ